MMVFILHQQKETQSQQENIFTQKKKIILAYTRMHLFICKG